MILNKNYTYYQNYVDIVSVKNKSNRGNIGYFNLLTRLISITMSMSNLININSFDDGVLISNKLIKNLKFDIKLINPEKLVNVKKVFISNHITAVFLLMGHRKMQYFFIIF